MSEPKPTVSGQRPERLRTKPLTSPLSNFSSFSQTLSRWTGFTKPSNLVLFSLTTGVFAIFSALQTRTLEKGNKLKPNPPGGPFWFKDGLLYWVMRAHLWSVVSAGISLPLQFLPAMRRRYMYFHRVSGRCLLILLLFGNITALTMVRYSFGGTITTQVWVITIAGMTTFSIYKAWTTIVDLQIDQHRVWVLRTWSYACTILTLRIFMIILAISIAKLAPNSFKSILPCDEIRYMYQYISNQDHVSSLDMRYPTCAGSSDALVIVNASLGEQRYPEERTALMNIVFGVSGWIALVIHVLLVEVYLNGSKDEDERLKKLSKVRRKAARFEVKDE